MVYKKPRVTDSTLGNPDLKRVSEEITPMIDLICLKYKQYFHTNPGEGIFQFWVNSDGRVEHAVCLRYKRLDINLIAAVVGDMENWVVTFTMNPIGPKVDSMAIGKFCLINTATHTISTLYYCDSKPMLEEHTRTS